MSRSPATVARELVRYKLDFVAVWVRWDKEDTVRAGDYTSFYGKETKIIRWEQVFCTLQNTEQYQQLRE